MTVGAAENALLPVEWQGQEVEAPVAGVSSWQLETPRIALAMYELEAGVDVPEHMHDGDEVGVVISGRIEVTVDGEVRSVGEGEVFLIPRRSRHSARTRDGACRLFEGYAPHR